MGIILLVLPLIGAAMSLVIRNKTFVQLSFIVIAGINIFVSFRLSYSVFQDGSAVNNLFFTELYLDSLSIIFVDIISVISFAVSLFAPSYMNIEYEEGRFNLKQMGIFYSLLCCFVFTMLLSVMVDNMGIMWIAIEATTLASAFLVGFYNSRESLEAAWKYVIICSVGIAVAFLGIILLHLSSLSAIGGGDALSWKVLYEKAAMLHQPTLRVAFIFILLGFGTKAGLAPMHTWLPGAHSQAPSPISALLSGVLLNSAMYGIIRSLSILNRSDAVSSYPAKDASGTIYWISIANSGGFGSRLMIAMGVLSIITAAVLIIRQQEYKSLLAYSSIEHMGVIAFALGLGTKGAIFGGLLHLMNHSFTKSMLFMSAGTVLQRYHSGRIGDIKGVLKEMPFNGGIFMIGLLAIAGTPPFSIFASEINIMSAVFSEGKILLGAAFSVLLAVIFAGIVYCLFKIFYGQAKEGLAYNPERFEHLRERDKAMDVRLGKLALAMLFVTILATGFYLPDEILVMLARAGEIVMGGAL